MDFIDEIRAFAKNIPTISEKIATEEGTKNALIMPFIRILGYDVFNPNEVNPEFIADVGTKKGEKVDYAIMKDGNIAILVECKPVSSDLSKEHASQLFRYFSVTPAKVAILTNGVVYQFFTDLEAKNKMDQKPFLEINLLDIKEPLVAELKKFTKQGFNVDELEDTASQLKYTREIIQIINKEFSKPSEEFVRFFAKQVYAKTLTAQAKDKFTLITKESLNQFLSDKINDRLKSAMEPDSPKQPTGQTDSSSPQPAEEDTEGIVTTEEEYEGYYIVKAILTETTDPVRVVMRDAKSYCAILFDDNNRKPICRFYFNTKQKFVGVFDNEARTENKLPINNLNELFKMADHFKKIIAMYEPKKPEKTPI
ncbi:MAG: type I restriction endonuclease [Methanoregula sp.]